MDTKRRRYKPVSHSPSELFYRADILGPDMVPRHQDRYTGIQDLTGRQLEQAQLVSSETTHCVVFQAPDVPLLDESCFIQIEEVLYVVDYKLDPRDPRPGMWLEVFCHVAQGGKQTEETTYSLDGGTF